MHSRRRISPRCGRQPRLDDVGSAFSRGMWDRVDTGQVRPLGREIADKAGLRIRLRGRHCRAGLEDSRPRRIAGFLRTGSFQNIMGISPGRARLARLRFR